MKIVLAFLLFFVAFSPLKGERPPSPQSNFSLQQLQIFHPGHSLKDIQQKHGTGTPFSADIRRFQISHRSYRFPLFVQFKANRSVGFWARLPTYLLHDFFHRSLIEQYGKQNRYLKKENSALFVWNPSPDLNIVYSGQCTITCFPEYLFITDPTSSTLLKDFSTLPPTSKPYSKEKP